jgi:hypothetical protein
MTAIIAALLVDVKVPEHIRRHTSHLIWSIHWTMVVLGAALLVMVAVLVVRVVRGRSRLNE